jgi:hypothetical protein
MFSADEYYEGKKAYREGCEYDENPYQEGSTEYDDWQDGWDDAQGEDWQPDWFVNSR